MNNNNSYLRTSSAIYILTEAGEHFTVPASHDNYGAIVDAVKAGEYGKIAGLFNARQTIADTVEKQSASTIRIDVQTGQVIYRDKPLNDVFARKLIELYRDHHDIAPYVYCLEKIEANPYPRVRQYFETLFDRGVTPINQSGNMIFYKRVDNDYKSFYDRNTDNTPGTVLRMDRSQADSDVNRPCSTGYHCCTHEYLPEYYGGEGRVVICEVNPTDIVAFIDAQGGKIKVRCTGYKIIGELGKPLVDLVENNKPAIINDIVEDDQQFDTVETPAYIEGYTRGYNDGRKRFIPVYTESMYWHGDDKAGYIDGYKDGKHHKPRKHRAVAGQCQSTPTTRPPWPFIV